MSYLTFPHHLISYWFLLWVLFICLLIFRTKALVLELLAAICLVKGGHEIILNAFNNFKDVCSETQRFQTLMNYFSNYDCFYIEFMVSFCLCWKWKKNVLDFHQMSDIVENCLMSQSWCIIGYGDTCNSLNFDDSTKMMM